MPQFIRPPVADVPYGGSLGANLGYSIADGVRGIMAAHDANEEKKKRDKLEAIAQAIGGEDRLIQLAPILSQFEPAEPTRMTNPSTPELGIPETPGPSVPLGESRFTKPLLSEITLPSGQKVPIPPVRGMREQLAAEDTASINKDTEILTEEAWKNLPEFFRGRWKPGQRVDSKALGTIGAAVFEAANKKATDIPNYKAQFDRQTSADVMVSDEMIAKDPNRYGPPREARVASGETAAAVRTAAAEARKDAAEAKAEAHKQAVQDAADRIVAGEPASSVSGTVRDAAVKIAKEGGARIYTTQAQKDKVIILDSISSDVARLKELLSDPLVVSYFGPGAGWLTGKVQALPEVPLLGPKIPPEVHEARSLMLNLQDRVLRQRSGAQINAAEMKRITQFSPDPTHQIAKTLINLNRMGAEIDAIVKAQVGGGTDKKGSSSPSLTPGQTYGRFKVISVEP